VTNDMVHINKGPGTTLYNQLSS